MTDKRPKWQTITSWALALLVGLGLIAAGGAKLSGAEQMVKNFEHWGFPPWFVTFTGVVEVLGGILTIIPRTRFYGALLLGGTMLGALATHVRAGELGMAAPSIVLGLMCAFLAFSHRPSFLGGSPSA